MGRIETHRHFWLHIDVHLGGLARTSGLSVILTSFPVRVCAPVSLLGNGDCSAYLDFDEHVSRIPAGLVVSSVSLLQSVALFLACY